MFNDFVRFVGKDSDQETYWREVMATSERLAMNFSNGSRRVRGFAACDPLGAEADA